MNQEKLKILTKGLGGKSKLAIFLLATGKYTFKHLANMTVSDLKNLDTDIMEIMPMDLKMEMDDIAFDADPLSPAFMRNSGKITSDSFRRILLKALSKQNIECDGLNGFVEYIAD